MFKTATKSLMVLFLSLNFVIAFSSNASANILNKFKKGFYFEKYRTAEEVKAALLKLHPVGSDVNSLVKTLEEAGAEKYEPVISEKYKSNPKLKNMIWYTYTHRTLDSLFPKRWNLSIQYDNDRKIEDYNVGFYQGE